MLRSNGHRVTRARRVVWDALGTDAGHLNAQQIAERVAGIDPTVNLSSVYRALGLFAELNLVRESRLGDAVSWERAHGDTFIHLVCDRCGAVQHHDSQLVAALRRQIDRTSAFAPATVDVRVSGRCGHCQA